MNHMALSTSPRPALLHPSFGLAYAQAHRAMMTADKRGLTSRASFIDGGRGRSKPYAFVEGIAIIGVQGCLEPNYPWIGDPWATGYDALRFQLQAAFADDDVSGIVLNIDSYGGMVAGCFDLCDYILEAKAAAKKPLVAILAEMAYSAAYAIAATADSISVPRTGGLGSIGVICVHWNIAGALEKWGEQPTLVFAGSHKADGNPFGPLSDDVRAEMQADVEATRQLFAETVARGRASAGVKLSQQTIIATEARCYDGPVNTAEAVRLGFADAVAAPDRAFAALVNQLSERT